MGFVLLAHFLFCSSLYLFLFIDSSWQDENRMFTFCQTNVKSKTSDLISSTQISDLISSTRHFRQNSITTTLINVLLTHSAFSSFSLREKVSHFRWRKTRKTRHSFALFLQERWIRVEWDFMISLFRLHKKTWRRHQPRWDEIAERRPLDLVAAPTFPTWRKDQLDLKKRKEKQRF